MCGGVRLTLFLGIALTMLFSCAAVADDSAMSRVGGGSLQPMDEHSTIRMVRETVDVKLGARVGYDWPVFTRCQFEFCNDGPSTDVWVGFPERAWAAGDTSAWLRVKSFKSWADGKPATVKYLKSSENKQGDSREEYKAWYVKKVHFDAGQTRKVVNVYSARLGAEGQAMSPVGVLFHLDYILRTGASWKGTIGEAVVNVDATAAGNYYDITASPTGCASKHNKLTWTFKDFEPKEDIAITFAPRLPLLNGKPLDDGGLWEPYFVRNGVVMAAPSFLGGQAEYTGKDYLIRYGGHLLKLRGGSRAAIIDGRKITLAHAPWKAKDSDDFAVPLDEVVRLLGGSVKYDSNHRPNVLLRPH